MNLETNGTTPVVRVDRVSKSFGETEALRQVSLEIPRGSITGLIGRNGAGKSTLLRHVSGLVLPTSGRVTTLGCPAETLGAAELERLGVVDQETHLLEWMTVEQHLRYVEGFYDRWDRYLEQDLLSRLELDTKPRVGALSGGDLQKLGLLLALCHRPELILLDEPVSAFDPVVRERMLQYLLDVLREDATTIVISSHTLSDVEKIVDHIVLLRRGRVEENGQADEIQERYMEWTVARIGESDGQMPLRFSEPFIARQSVSGNRARLIVEDAEGRLAAFRERHRVDVVSRPLSLEQALLHLLEENG